MSNHEPYNEPTEVLAEQGQVLVSGPDGVAVSLTPAAALETSERLLKAGLQAQGQALIEEGAVRRG